MKQFSTAWRRLRRAPRYLVTAAGSLTVGTAVAILLSSVLRLEPGFPPGVSLRVRSSLSAAPVGGIEWSDHLQTAAGLHARGLERLGWLLVGLGGVVLLACAVNVAVLLMQRLGERRWEITVRRAVGASRAVLRRELAAEGAMVATAGLAGGVAAGYSALRGARRLVPDDVIVVGGLVPDVAAAAALALVPLAALGVAYAVGSIRALRSPSGAPGSGSFSQPRLFRGRGGESPAVAPGLSLDPAATEWEKALAVTQVAGVTALLLVGGVLVRATGSEPPGSGDPERRTADRLVTTIRLEPAEAEGGTERRADSYRRLQDVLDGSSGPDLQLALASRGLWLGLGPRDRLLCRGCVRGAMSGPVLPVTARVHGAGPGLFDTLGIRVTGGREFTAADGRGRGRVALVNRAFATRHGVRVGRAELQLPGRAFHEEWYRVVGVLEHRAPRGPATTGQGAPAVYLPLLRHPPARAAVVMAGPPGTLEPSAARRIVGSRAGPGITVESATVLTAELRRYAVPLRRAGRAASLLAVAAVLLTAVGLGVSTQLTVERHWRELGIRRAFGARRRDVLDLMARDRGRVLRRGLAVGIIAGGAVVRGLVLYFDGVRLFDPVLYGSLAALLATVVAGGSWPPLRHAMRASPRELVGGR